MHSILQATCAVQCVCSFARSSLQCLPRYMHCQTYRDNRGSPILLSFGWFAGSQLQLNMAMLVRRSLCVSWITPVRLVSSYIVLLPFLYWHSFCWSLYRFPKKDDVSLWKISASLKTKKHHKNLNKTPGDWHFTIFHFEMDPWNGAKNIIFPPSGRSQGWENVAAHVRQVFGRMGFNDREAETGEDGDSFLVLVGQTPTKKSENILKTCISLRI